MDESSNAKGNWNPVIATLDSGSVAGFVAKVGDARCLLVEGMQTPPFHGPLENCPSMARDPPRLLDPKAAQSPRSSKRVRSRQSHAHAVLPFLSRVNGPPRQLALGCLSPVVNRQPYMPDYSGAAVKSHARQRPYSPARGQRAQVQLGHKDLVDANLKGCRDWLRRGDCARVGRRARAEVDENGYGCLPPRNLRRRAMMVTVQRLLHERVGCTAVSSTSQKVRRYLK